MDTTLQKPPVDSSQDAMNVHLSYIRRDIDAINKKLDTLPFVTREEFAEHLKTDEDHESRIRVLEKESEDHALVKRVVYGAVAFILLAVLSSIVYLVIKK